MHAVPIRQLETGMLCLERQLGGCLIYGGGEPICHVHKLHPESASNHPQLEKHSHTVDIGSGRERGVMRQRLGHIIVCSVHIFVFLRAFSNMPLVRSLVYIHL